MRILVNASTLVVGGGIQIGVSFIQIAVQRKGVEYLFIVSKGIYDNLSPELKEKYNIQCCEISPAHPINGYKSRKWIKQLEKDFNPDFVYSLGFPSYIKFNKPEVGRYTNPWEINSEPLPWNIIPGGFIGRLKTKLGIWYRLMWAKRTDYMETQTEAAKLGIARRASFDINKIKVIPNSPNPVFIEQGKEIEVAAQYNRQGNAVFCLAAGYSHKNLNIIPSVAKILKDKYGKTLKFQLTLPFGTLIWKDVENRAKELGVSDLVINVGPLKLKDCLPYYKAAKLVFLPTLMEIFSATYLEAMSMKVPIVTTDLEFAHDNCGTAAAFFEPQNANSAADVINKVLNDQNYYKNLIEQGLNKLNSYPTLTNKYEILFKWFEDIKLINEE